MPNPLLLDSLLLGLQHSFEPDHVAAVSVLATEKDGGQRRLWRLLWRSSQWAVGHSLTLISFGVLVLILKSTFSLHVAGYVEFFIGPVMIWLGVSAYLRNWRKKKVNTHTYRSFWIGMLHGLAGTGAACTIALTLAAKDSYTAVGILVIQSVSIITVMTTYGYLFAISAGRFASKWQPSVRVINYIVGTFSIIVGCFILIESIKNL